MSGSHNRADGSDRQPGFGDIDLLDVLGGVWRRKLQIAVCAAAGLGLAVLYLATATPNYVSEVRLLIDRTDSELTRPVQSSPDPAAQLEFDKQAVESQVQILLSRDLAMEVGRKLDLQGEPDFQSSGGLMSLIGLGSSRKSSEESFLEAYYDRLVVYQVRESRVIGVVFRASDPELAAKVANTLIETYLRVQGEAKAQATERAGSWLEEQVNVLRARLAEAEAKVQAFRARNGLYSPRENQSLDSQQLAELNSELIRAKAQRSEAQARAMLLRDMLKRGTDIESAAEVVQSPLMQRLVEQRIGLRGQISELSATLGPRHPRLLELQAELGGLTAQVRTEALKIAESFENEARLAGARERALAESLDAQKTATSLSEEQQIELRALERDAATERELLTVYLARLGEAVARQEPEIASANARVISAARPPLAPATPKKAASLFIGLFGGFLIGFIIAMTRAILAAQREALSGEVDHPQAHGEAELDVVQLSTPAVSAPSPSFVTPYSTIQSLPDLARHMQDTAKAFGFSRLLCLYSGERSLMPRQLVRGLCHAGGRCLLIETGADASCPGLAEALRGEAELAEVIRRDKVSSAHIIAGGQGGLAESETGRFEVALKALQEAYTHIIIAMPDTAVSAELLALAPQVFTLAEPDEALRNVLANAEQVLVFAQEKTAPATAAPQQAPISA